jgi:hypothetical protein
VYVELDSCTFSWRASNLNECRAAVFRAPQIVLTGSVHICRAPSTLLVLLLCVHIRANRPKCTRCVRGCVRRDMTSFVCGSNNKSSINLLNTLHTRDGRRAAKTPQTTLFALARPHARSLLLESHDETSQNFDISTRIQMI